jgi:hypothetical protein
MTTITDYQRWRETPGGRIHSLLYPTPGEAIAEVQQTVGVEKIRTLMDTHEITYGRRPTVAEARACLDRGWLRGQGFSGSADDLTRLTESAYPGTFTIRHEAEKRDDHVRVGKDVMYSPPGSPV